MLKNFMIALVLVLSISEGALGARKPFACPEVGENGKDGRELAGDYFASASTAFQKKTFKKALKLFVSSLCVAEHRNTVYNIAQSVFYMKNKTAARKILMTYAESRGDSSSAEEIKQIINRLDGQLGKELSFPEVEMVPEPLTAPEPVTAPEPETAPEPVTAPEEPDAQEQRFEDHPPEPDEEEKRPVSSELRNDDRLILGQTKMRFSSFVLMGTGTAMLLTGAIVQGLSFAAKLEAEKAKSFSTFEEEAAKRKDLQAGAIVCFAVGGAAAATGIALFFLDRSRSAKAGHSVVSTSVRITPTLNGLSVTGIF